MDDNRDVRESRRKAELQKRATSLRVALDRLGRSDDLSWARDTLERDAAEKLRLLQSMGWDGKRAALQVRLDLARKETPLKVD